MASFTRTTAIRALPKARGQPPGLLILERYRLQRPLGAGAFGTVWMARDERLERDVAVKVLARERIVGGRFEREARAAARLSHPGIVTLYEAAVDDDGAYLVSELVRGSTLSELLEAGRLSDRDIVEIGIALCDALAHAHAQGVVHRDLKPSNVLVPERPAASQTSAKLTDFGVARLIGADSLTRTGDVVGTAAYMAPEQADGREAGAPADLYSLALVLYEALTGVNPIAHGTAARRARRLGAHLPPLRRQRRDLPGELGHGLDLALRPRPRERGTVEELHAELMSSLHRLDDEPGIVGSPWPSRPDPRPAPPEAQARPDPAPSPPLPRPQRALAGAAAGVAVAWLTTLLPTSPPAVPVAAGLSAAVIVAALPRLGWLALPVAFAGLLALAGRPGSGLVVALAGIVPVVLMPRHRTSWPLAAAAAGLGAVGLAGAWPALAGRLGSAGRRAAVAATGWIWVLAAGLLAGHGLYTRLPRGLSASWPESLAGTAGHVLPDVLNPGLLAPAGLWALAALVLPWLTSRSLALQVVLVSAWSAAVASGTATILRVMHSGVQPRAGAVVLGALAGAAVALAPAVLRAWKTAFRSPDTAAGLA